jgi:hypothetical protein
MRFIGTIFHRIAGPICFMGRTMRFIGDAICFIGRAMRCVGSALERMGGPICSIEGPMHFIGDAIQLQFLTIVSWHCPASRLLNNLLRMERIGNRRRSAPRFSTAQARCDDFQETYFQVFTFVSKKSFRDPGRAVTECIR